MVEKAKNNHIPEVARRCMRGCETVYPPYPMTWEGKDRNPPAHIPPEAKRFVQEIIRTIIRQHNGVPQKMVSQLVAVLGLGKSSSYRIWAAMPEHSLYGTADGIRGAAGNLDNHTVVEHTMSVPDPVLPIIHTITIHYRIADCTIIAHRMDPIPGNAMPPEPNNQQG
jgi:hypothetical protein